MPRSRVAPKYPHYPKIFNVLAILQIIASGVVVIFFWVAWANIGSSPVLRENLALVEKTPLGALPNEWRSPWYFKLVGLAGAKKAEVEKVINAVCAFYSSMALDTLVSSPRFASSF